VAHLAEPPADAGLLFDDRPRRLGRAHRVLEEEDFQRGPVFGQGALGAMTLATAQARQATLEILVEGALDGASGDVGGGGDLVVVQPMALQPEDLDLTLDTRVGVMIPVVGQGVPVVRREGNRPHDGPPRCCP